jgi:hypothetical protein
LNTIASDRRPTHSINAMLDPTKLLAVRCSRLA